MADAILNMINMYRIFPQNRYFLSYLIRIYNNMEKTYQVRKKEDF